MMSKGRWISALPLVLALGGCATAATEGTTYLVSIGDITLGRDEQMKAFSFATWGVRFEAVCHVPQGWTITAGGGVTPDGELGGHGSNGISWYREPSPAELKDLALITQYGPVQAEDELDEGGHVVIPATFNGSATIETDDGDRTQRLTDRNIRLRAASRCPRS